MEEGNRTIGTVRHGASASMADDVETRYQKLYKDTQEYADGDNPVSRFRKKVRIVTVSIPSKLVQ